MPAPGDRVAWLKGPGHLCGNAGSSPWRALRLVLLGPPGAGKGTQAQLIVARHGACHLSTGDVFRAALGGRADETSPAMRDALTAMRRGELVADDLVLAIVRERVSCLVCRQGCILDGFTRTVAQARAFDGVLANAGVKLDAVVSLVAPDALVVARVSGRWVCRRCKMVWHIEHQCPRLPGVGDACGGDLQQRADDDPAAIRTRLAEYHATAQPVEDYYRGRAMLHDIDTSAAPAAVAAAIAQTLPGHQEMPGF